jgi:ABC-type glycerol-3-phosphate transport system substrate-binding protein
MSRILGSLTTAAALCVVLAAAAAPAHAHLTSNSLTFNSLTFNSLTYNSLTPTGSQLGELNGVAVEAVTLPDKLAR